MKSLLATFVSIVLLQTAAAQGVYVIQGEQGPIFSDKPQPGAREVALPPLNVVAPPQEPRPVGGVLPDNPRSDAVKADPASYRDFSIVQPENDGSVVANNGAFEVRVAVDPPLQLGAGHAIVVSINGRPVGLRFTASELTVPPQFWGDLPPPNQDLQLDASIVDGAGRVLKSAAPVRFVMRHATLLNQPRRHPPPPAPKPPPEPPPRPAKATGVGAVGPAAIK